MQRTPRAPALRTLPNVLSISRLLLAALFIPAGQWGRLVLIALAALTDFLDGWVARHSETPSRWGAIIDPIGDRAFAVTAFVVCLATDAIGPGELAVLLSRDIATAIGFVVARAVRSLRDVKLAARFPGKLVTTLQFVALVLIVAARPSAVTVLVVLTGLVSMWAIADYTVALWRARAR